MATFGASERRRRNINRISDMTAKDTTVSGRNLILGTGEISIDLKFPISFTARPVFHWGGELGDNYRATAGAFPRIHAIVSGWEVKNAVEGAFDGFFVGATVAVTVEGDTGVQMWLHWSFRGAGIRNPIVGLEDTDSEI